MEEIRLNKYLSERGAASRREADRLIEEGRVTVNGRPAVTGMRVTAEDTVLLDGRPLGDAEEKVVLALYKPKNVVCTTRTFPGEENVLRYVDRKETVYPVGRLDKDSEGLLLLTNDGDLAKEITSAGRHEKEYEVLVNKDLTDHFLARMEKGVFLADLNKTTAGTNIVRTGRKKFRIILKQGLNRQIRRMCETLGYRVLNLKRIRIMNVTLGAMKSGECREITGTELAALREEAFRRTPPEEAGRETHA